MDGHDRPLFHELLSSLVTSTIFVNCQHLIARKLAVLFGFNRGIQPFYAARCFDYVSRGSVSCLLKASFEKQFPQRHNSICYAEIDDHGFRWGDTGRILTRSRHSVASRVALDLPYWVMRSASYCLTCMTFEMAREAGACFSVIDFMSCINIAKRPCYSPLKIKPSCIIVH